MRKARIWGGFVVLLGVLCLVSSTGWANTIYVNCPSDSLQNAIDDPNTQPLDTISVTGTCTESVNVTKDNLILTGSGTAVIISKTQDSPAIKVSGRNVTIDGFDISGGAVGIRVSDLSSANITNNTIHDNAAGILVRESSSAHIGFVHYKDAASQPNVISGNVEGIMVTACSSASIAGNTIQGNTDNGIVVEKVSQANVAGNLISGNTKNGISLTGNSGVNLAADTPGTIFDLPNYTSAKNAGYGIACMAGGNVTGNQGGLTGAKGAASFAANCINGITAPPASQYLVVGTWNVDYPDACSNVTDCPDVVTFKAGATQLSGTGTIHFPDNPSLSMTWSMKGEILSITNSNGIFYGTVTWTAPTHVTYNFIEPGRSGTSVIVLHK